jgi:hypothetical protein
MAFFRLGTNGGQRVRASTQIAVAEPRAAAVLAHFEHTAATYAAKANMPAANAVLDAVRVKKHKPSRAQVRKNIRLHFTVSAAAIPDSIRNTQLIPWAFGGSVPAKRYPDPKGWKVPRTISAVTPTRT